MFTKKSVKFLIISLLSTISLTGYLSVYPSSIFAQNENETPETLESKPENKQSTSTIKAEYDKLLKEYNNFAEYIYKIDENGQPINEDETVTKPEEKLALGKLTQFLNEQSQNSPTLIEDKDQILQGYSTQFNNFISQVDKFKQEINNLSDETKKQQILTKFENSENQDLWLISDTSKSLRNYFLDGELKQEEICDMQSNLGIQKEDECGKNGKGNFGKDTYSKLEEKLTSTTQELKNKLDEIKPLIVEDTSDNSNDQTNNNTNNQTDNNTDSNSILGDKNLIISSLALLIGIISSLLSLITLLKLLNYQKENKEEIDRLKQQSDQKNNKINQLNEEIDRLKRQKNNPPPVQTFRPDYDNINPGYIPPQITSQSNLFKSTDLRTKPNSEPEIPTSIPTNIVSNQNDDSNNLITSYQTNPQSFLQQGTKVRMTTETTNKVLDGTWNDVVNLEQHRAGEYSVITNDYQNYYVVLDPHTKFNPQTLQIINKSKLFICYGNLSNTVKGEDIQINKPAKVRKDQEYWTLIESGELTL